MHRFELFVDSDGVIADFDGYVKTHFGKPVSAFEKGTFWAALTHRDTHVEKFFRSLPKMPDADVLVEYLRAQPVKSVKVLTACGYTPKDAKEQKVAWYDEHYPGLECIVVSKSPDKAEYAHPYAILIDDRAKSIDPWVAKGGIGILHTSAEDTIAQLVAIFESMKE